MRSTYKKLGPYIQEVDVRNTDLQITYLRGISSIFKEFVESKANIVGVEFHNYKVVRRGQFAFNPNTARMGDKIPIALNAGDDCIVSSIYPVFEVRDEKELLPAYLMMWFRRPEFDRYARFKSHGSAREIFSWDEMCDVELPIPSTEKQREIVKEYQTVVDRILLNERLNEKLEEAAQAIYKQWFVDFEFPMTAEYAESIGKPELEGQPYKSSGGAMEYNEVLELEIPTGWKDYTLNDLCTQVCVGFVGSCYDSYCDSEAGIPMMRTTDLTESGMSYQNLKYVTPEFHARNKKSQLHKGDVLVARHGSNGMPVIFDRDFEANCLNTIIVKPNEERMNSKLLHEFLLSEGAIAQIRTSLGGSVQDVLNTKRLLNLRLAYPEDCHHNEAIARLLVPIQESIEVIRKEIEALGELRDLSRSRIAQGAL